VPTAKESSEFSQSCMALSAFAPPSIAPGAFGSGKVLC
jgi:hypothetical protein